MKMHNDPHSWQGWLELFQSWWRGDTPLGAVLMSLFMAGLRIAYFGGSGGWKKKTLEILLCGALTLTFSSALDISAGPSPCLLRLVAASALSAWMRSAALQ